MKTLNFFVKFRLGISKYIGNDGFYFKGDIFYRIVLSNKFRFCESFISDVFVCLTLTKAAGTKGIKITKKC